MNTPLFSFSKKFKFAILTTFLIASSYTLYGEVNIYPMPPNAIRSSVFQLSVNDNSTNVIDYMDYHYAHFAFDENVVLTLTSKEKIYSYKISPRSLNIKATIQDNKLTFNLSQVSSKDETPRYLVVQINNQEKFVILGDKPEVNAPQYNQAGIYRVTASPYNADSTGVAYTQPSIQKAIDDASAAGGGIVYVPYGLYQIKQELRVKSNVELYLAPGAVLKAIDDRAQYAQNSTIPPAVMVNSANNAKITGRGEIDASGYKLMSPPAGFTSQSVEHPRRRALQLDYANHITLNGIIVKDATGWTVELMRSNNLDVQNVKVLNHKDVTYKIENDGIDIVSSSNTVVNQCFVITIDDAYCSKARYTNMDNCEFSNNVSYNWSGGVKAGMQSVGDMTNILFRNCDVIHCRRGIGVDTREGTKSIENVEFRDIRVEETEQTISGSNYCVEFEAKLAPISNIKITRLTSYENKKVKFWGAFNIMNTVFEDFKYGNELIKSDTQLNLSKESKITVTYTFNTTQTGIRSLKNQNNANVTCYPIPANEKLHFKSNDTLPFLYSIHPMTGQCVLSGQAKGNSSIDISELSPGNYIININKSNNCSSIPLIKI